MTVRHGVAEVQLYVLYWVPSNSSLWCLCLAGERLQLGDSDRPCPAATAPGRRAAAAAAAGGRVTWAGTCWLARAAARQDRPLRHRRHCSAHRDRWMTASLRPSHAWQTDAFCSYSNIARDFNISSLSLTSGCFYNSIYYPFVVSETLKTRDRKMQDFASWFSCMTNSAL